MLLGIRYILCTLGADQSANASGQILQRIYKYGGQPFVRDYLAKNHGGTFERTFGDKTGKAMMSSFAGR